MTSVPDPTRRARFEAWIARFGPELYQVSMRRLGGRTPLAEELVHEAYLVAWRKIDTFEGDDEGARRWLHRIAYNLTPAFWRRNPNAPELTPEQLHRHRAGEETGEAAVDPEEVTRLKGCLDELETLDRDIVGMRYGLHPDPEAPDERVELSWAEVADQVGRRTGGPFQPDQARMRAARAMTKLRKCMQRHEESNQGPAPAGGRPGRGGR